MEKNNLTLRIKRKWLEEIVFGKKRIEYRDNTNFYAQRLVITKGKEDVARDFDSVEFYCPIGSTGKNLRAEVKFKGLTYSEKLNQFEIHLGKIISHNLPEPKAKKK